MDRKTKAEKLFKSGYNCAQSVIGAFCDDIDLDFDTAMKLSEGFGGGMGRMRLTCGAVSGMTMVAGMILSRGSGDGDTRSVVYDKVHKMAEEYAKKNGSVICGDLLGINKENVYNPTPDVRTEEYYKKRPCSELVRDCVEIVEKYFDLD